MSKVELSDRSLAAVEAAVGWTKQCFGDQPDFFDGMTLAQHELWLHESRVQRVDRGLGSCPRCKQFLLVVAPLLEEDLVFNISRCLNCGWWG